MNNRHVHLFSIDTQHNTFRCVFGAIKVTPVSWLSVLCDIVQANLRRKKLLKNTYQIQISIETRYCLMCTGECEKSCAVYVTKI